LKREKFDLFESNLVICIISCLLDLESGTAFYSGSRMRKSGTALVVSAE